jgi:superfamily I DNA/RNA helicase
MAQEQGAELPPSIELYGTHRLDRRTAQFLEAKTRVRMHSFRDESERCTVRWKTAIQHETHTLVLCRKNESVIQTATQSEGMRIVGGADLKKKLQAVRSSTDEKPFSKYAQALSATEFQRICKLLEDRSIELEDLASPCDVSAVSTVHQCKGFEYDHVTLHEDLLQCNEPPVLYVAMTRHRKSLTVITGCGDGQEFAKRRRLDAPEDGDDSP